METFDTREQAEAFLKAKGEDWLQAVEITDELVKGEFMGRGDK